MSEKKYLAKIIAVDNEGLQMISACCAGAITNVSNIKYLKENKVFLLSMERTKVEADEEDKKVNSICKFDFVSNVKSKNINQKNPEMPLELIGINYNNLEFNLKIEKEIIGLISGTNLSITDHKLLKLIVNF